MKTTTTDYLFQRIRYLISALCCTVSCCTVSVSWYPKPWVSRSNREGWKVCFLFLAHQKLLPSFPSPLDVTGASPFPPRSFLSLVCITYFEFRPRRISGTKTDYSWSTKRRHNGFENGTRDKFATHLRREFSLTVVYIHKLWHTPRILRLGSLWEELVLRIQKGGLTTHTRYTARHGETSRVFLDMALF